MGGSQSECINLEYRTPDKVYFGALAASAPIAASAMTSNPKPEEVLPPAASECAAGVRGDSLVLSLACACSGGVSEFVFESALPSARGGIPPDTPA